MKSRLSNGDMVLEMKSSSEGVHSLRIAAKYCFPRDMPEEDKDENSSRDSCAMSCRPFMYSTSDDNIGRGDGAGVGGDTIGM